jgi:hypothetical protein
MPEERPESELRTLIDYGRSLDQVEELERTLAALREEMLARERELHALREKAAPGDLDGPDETVIARAVDGVAAMRAKLEEAEARMKRAQDEAARLVSQVAAQDEDLARLREEAQRLSAAESQAADLQARLTEREWALAESQDQAQRAERTAAALRASAKSLEAKAAEAERLRQESLRAEALKADEAARWRMGLIATAVVLAAVVIWALFRR